MKAVSHHPATGVRLLLAMLYLTMSNTAVEGNSEIHCTICLSVDRHPLKGFSGFRMF